MTESRAGAPDDDADQLKRLRDDVETLRRERDAYRADLDYLRGQRHASASSDLQLLGVKLAKEIREDFYTSVSRMVWAAAILLGVATFGGYLRFDDIIDDKIDDRINVKRSQMEAEIDRSLADFRSRTTAAISELVSRGEEVRRTGETVMKEMRSRGISVNVETTRAGTTVTAGTWNAWFGIMPANVVGIAGSAADEYGFETRRADGQTVGAFSEAFRRALLGPATDTDRNGSRSWREVVSAAAATLKEPKQSPTAAGALVDTTALSVQAGGTPRGRLHVLLVGINKYGKQMDLVGPVNDVREFDALLKKQSLADTTLGRVETLLDAGATLAGIEAALGRLTSTATEDDVVLFYYSGHVSQNPDTSGASTTKLVKVLVPRDFDSGKLLPVPDVARALGKTRARLAVMVIDG